MRITYTKAKRELNDLGLIIGQDLNTFIIYTKNSNAVAVISKTIQYELDSLNFNLDELDKDSRKHVAKIAWGLAATPIDQREKPKQYYIHRVPELGKDGYIKMHIFGNLIIGDKNGMKGDYLCKFTMKEIHELEAKYHTDYSGMLEEEGEY